MDRFARTFMPMLLLAAAGLGAGCSSGGGVLTGSTTAAAGAPGTVATAGRRGDEKFDPNKVFEESANRGSQ